MGAEHGRADDQGGYRQQHPMGRLHGAQAVQYRVPEQRFDDEENRHEQQPEQSHGRQPPRGGIEKAPPCIQFPGHVEAAETCDRHRNPHLRREAAPPTDLEALRSNPLELGWRLHPDFWHQGLASEAAARMTAFAFDDLSAAELLAVRHPDNVASGQVMDRLGMRFRGLEPWYGMSLATHSLTKAEWQSQQPQPGEVTREVR